MLLKKKLQFKRVNCLHMYLYNLTYVRLLLIFTQRIKNNWLEKNTQVIFTPKMAKRNILSKKTYIKIVINKAINVKSKNMKSKLKYTFLGILLNLLKNNISLKCYCLIIACFPHYYSFFRIYFYFPPSQQF